ncbi:MAG: 4-hydroxy-tetrahydrodipicolinate reductase [Clostridiales bacterium]|nr:4-hydroxy-tetrahydrodipicolinate reductase [Clostridiales bacterium]
MLGVALVGYGKMGRQVEAKIKETKDIECVAIVSPSRTKTLDEVRAEIDVIIDFSHPDNLVMIGEYAKKHNIPIVIATTGYEQAQIDYINELAGSVPVVYAANFSLGVTVMTRVVSQLAELLASDFDIEIIETHHNQKLDAPSGTAKMLLEAVDPAEEYSRVYGRKGDCKRKKEIGIHAIRAGNIAGKHTVLFAGEDETLEITHTATSKQIFANGAIKAARYAVTRPPGLYNMNHVLFKGEE